MRQFTIDTHRMSKHYGSHCQRPIVKVRLWDSLVAYRGWRMQFFDALDSYPHVYEPTADDLLRLLRAVKGWDCEIKDGVWEWTRPVIHTYTVTFKNGVHEPGEVTP